MEGVEAVGGHIRLPWMLGRVLAAPELYYEPVGELASLSALVADLLDGLPSHRFE